MQSQDEEAPNHAHQRGEVLKIPEWEDERYRQAEGWKGTDLVHHPEAPVRIHEYRVECTTIGF